ncbi:MAG TPA: PilZ domain-containing protein [Polyangiaceae bacterium]|nr:PilZ domain-containing protein [Polyangiaceae bacterium]
MKNRRSLIPSGADPGGVHATRRGGARHELSARVSLKPTSLPPAPVNGAAPLEGWALNVSRGGVRVILEQKVELGAEFEVTISSPEEPMVSQVGRIVWVQEEPDGVVAGIEFRDAAEE